MPLNLPLGPVMCDVAGLALTNSEREVLCHPLVGGVVLFSRNYQSPQQVAALTADIHGLREPALIVTVDHEGGRVQRFREGFTRLPAMRLLGELWEADPESALAAARHTGFVLAAELLAVGVDLSFTPVLDVDFGRSAVIGDRAFHDEPQVAADLAEALMEGLREAGMGAVGKHFPGHGYAEADSHVAVPVDTRTFSEVWLHDILPYRHDLSTLMTGVMPAHVIYKNIDPNPAGFSRFWLQDILRGRLQYDGVIFSDDLTMEGATVVGDIVARAEAAVNAGCDMVLVCNRPDLTEELLRRWSPKLDLKSSKRILSLAPRPAASHERRLAHARETVAALANGARPASTS